MNESEPNSGPSESPEEVLSSSGYTIAPVSLTPEAQRFSPESPSSSVPSETQVIDDRAKRYKPIANKVVKLLDSAGCRVVERKAKRVGFNSEQCEAFSDSARMEAETKELIADSSSRIAARYVKSEQNMEIAALTSGLADWMLGLQAAIKEIANAAPKIPQP